ncbi:hypothetical protein BW13_10815 [Bifidobacterium sp. UTCIF-37]|uniref:hypothetical protein n=1 Tax=unclassified Bifidobacterium TaxID=2608897 RepID=UPI00112C1890|nr:MULTISPECIES: hypothetical protein [unclassified Bifidobacterium]TPF85451.1 hypothetical protein BW13_10815 [Bifidobacterium sp. UTCIF-37]TPF87523.1 hypothetical protein BW11_10925 [Bifidobacterium sp. UTCIF-38]
MRIIEQCCQGKHTDQTLNEDGLFVSDRFAAVVDGVTGKSVRHPWDPSGGVVAKDTMLDALASLSADAGMRDVQYLVDERFRAAYQAHPLGPSFFEHEPLERLQANAVVYSVSKGEAWLFGDCQIMVNGVQTPTLKKVDELLGDLRSFAAQALHLMEAGKKRDAEGERDTLDDVGDAGTAETAAGTRKSPDDPAREMILPFLRLQSQFANRRGEYGYFVFDGFTDPTYPIQVVPVRPGDEVVLASDGYPLLAPTLDGSERELERLRHEDPQLIREYRSTKGFTAGLRSFDDRTYLRFIA